MGRLEREWAPKASAEQGQPEDQGEGRWQGRGLWGWGQGDRQ